MKIITKKFKVYTYDELTIEVKHRVINEHIHWCIEHIPYNHMSPNMKRACDKAESMQTPWFAGSYVADYAMNEIVEYVKTQNYLINGDVFNE